MIYYVVPFNSFLDSGVSVRSDSPVNAVSKYLSYYPLNDLVVYEADSHTFSFNFYTKLRFVSFYSIKNLKKLNIVT